MKKHTAPLPVVENPRKVETAFLVGVQYPDDGLESVNELLDELNELSRTLGVRVTGQQIAPLSEPRPRYLLGSGKASEIIDKARDAGADVIIFDDPLSPAQQRNWEQLANMAVIDRQEVILDIFGQRAHTREAELQIALARSEYDLPRLKRRWTHLSRQRGAGTLRGEGEQQIEVDSRLVKTRIAKLRRQLDEVRVKRRTQRKKRLQRPIPNATLVGYTNAGKSSLLNALTGADVVTENKLFVTLDPTTRRVVLPNHQTLVLSDTVGFIRKLPHSLIDAFKATLEEAAVADFVIEVLDAGSKDIEHHHETTRQVLRELGIDNKFTITVCNKVDLVTDNYTVPRLRRRFGDPVFVSAKTGQGIDDLIKRLAGQVGQALSTVDLSIPHERYDLVALLHRTCNVVDEKTTDEGTEIRAAIPDDVMASVKNFINVSFAS